MPSERCAGSDSGLPARAFSERVMVSALAEMAEAQALSAKMPVRSEARAIRMVICLAIGIEHVFEAHPLRIEEQVHVPGGTVAILAHEEFRRPLDVARRLVHILAEQAEDHVRMLLARSERDEIVA